MPSEYRPRLRASRKHPVSRKGNTVIAMCKDEDDAKAVEKFLTDLFTAARMAEKIDLQQAKERQAAAQDAIMLEAFKAASGSVPATPVAPEVTDGTTAPQES